LTLEKKRPVHLGSKDIPSRFRLRARTIDDVQGELEELRKQQEQNKGKIQQLEKRIEELEKKNKSD
jgi:predicted  nucleic acid-binding Zn-ribbon protein